VIKSEVRSGIGRLPRHLGELLAQATNELAIAHQFDGRRVGPGPVWQLTAVLRADEEGARPGCRTAGFSAAPSLAMTQAGSPSGTPGPSSITIDHAPADLKLRATKTHGDDGPICTVAVIPATSRTPSGTWSMWMRTGTRCASRTQVKIGLTEASPA
jgi:hypothetical protein